MRSPTIIDRFTTMLTGKVAPLHGEDLVRSTTASVPEGLLQQLHLPAYNPQLLDLFRPNRLAREKGWGVIEDMQTDSQIRANSAIKRGAPTSKGYTLTPANDSPEARQINDFCKDNLGDLERPLPIVNYDIMESTFVGMSISESIYRYQKGGVYDGKLMLQDLQTRPPSMVDVRFDAAGQIRGVVRADQYGAWNQELLNPFKFVIHTWMPKYGSPYGQGDAAACYRHHWAKEFLLRAHSIYMDKFGSPAIIGRIGPSMSKKDLDKFEHILKHVQAEGYALLPPDWQYEWLFPSGGSANPQAFLDAIQWHDSQMALAMLGSILSTNESSTGAGTFAQAKVHESTRDLILARVKMESELVARRQILRRLVLINFGRDAAMRLTPKFEYSPQDLDDVTQLVDAIVQLITAGVIDASEPWIRERLFLPPHGDVQEHVEKLALDKAKLQKAVQNITMPHLNNPRLNGQENPDPNAQNAAD